MSPVSSPSAIRPTGYAPPLNADDRPGISVVVPVYRGSPGVLEQLCTRLQVVLSQLTDRFEIILVDDRSPTDDWRWILALQHRHASVRGLRLSRNFGQHIAITAGMTVAKGDRIVVMDCDLQDPPELIADLTAKMEEGYDLVLARRATRSHSGLRILAARLYFRLMSLMTEEEIDGSYGCFCLLSRKVVDNFLQFSERERHFLFVLRWLGFRAGSVDYHHAARAEGRSSYSFGRLVKHAVDGMFFQSTALLRWIVALGLGFAGLGGLTALFLVAHFFAAGVTPGWTSLAVLLLIGMGVIVTSIGIVGLYIGKIFDQVKERPLYVVDVESNGPSLAK